ncbi:Apoptosis-inducing factor 1, mitochondrial [Galdieria sulphuraria]|uniref:Programmed cell death 8 (Apoptosis-inducing factor) n=1 Tax=Galdieria sulphuraria TaxID=130081 RepID=M2XGS7_GALSU|nr:programmed cell death 8 (apoptosis-inducing factor) [Galdieria sulphuraria]EME29272.1 programmed cell death 8 (apoptosis-inducing factor) [Galdieria sulphuraria]GJD05917.1 Apoptosis-inducing factor 1, mitochondrial [Galdieria sulphuraria]|eukprot:XP_005705792.1 programmed cell death 8 (apoptosis-inducing factor) [Galdieria sulphuraria]
MAVGWTKVFSRCTLAALLGTSMTWVHYQVRAEEQQDTTVLKQRAAIVLSKARESLSLEALYKQKAAQIIEKYYQRQGRSKSDTLETVVAEPLSSGTDEQQGIPASAFFRELSNTSVPLCVPFVIVGGGTAAWSALEVIYEKNPSAQVLVVTEEPYAPYNRTPLSKEMWSIPTVSVPNQWPNARAELEYKYHLPGQPETYRASILMNVSVTQLYPKENKIKLSNGMEVFYQKLLLATGGKPNVSELINNSSIDPSIHDSIITFRSISDFERLHNSFINPKYRNITILGGGFLGSELACSLQTRLNQEHERNKQVTLLCPEAGVLGKFLPRYLSDYITKQMRQHNVDVRPGVSVFDIVPTTSTDSSDETRIQLQLFGWKDKEHITDQVVIAVGITPRQELAEEAGLEMDPVAGGIRVNAAMQVEGNIYAAGDVASFWDRALGRRRVEHWDHAVVTGRIAGENMSGGHATYEWESMFWCDLVGLNISFEATGMIDASLRTIGVWNLKNTFRRGEFSDQDLNEGVVWYLRGNQVVGALLWNREGKGLDVARQVIGTKFQISSVQDLTNLIPVQDESGKQAPFVIDSSVLGSHQTASP